MKRLYSILLAILLCTAVITATGGATAVASPPALATPTPTAGAHPFLNLSSWLERTYPLTRLRRTATPTPRYNKVIYPLPSDAEVVPVWDTNQTTIFYTYLSMEQVMDFYRTDLTANGATERSLLTVSDEEKESWFSMVFDDWKYAPGRSLVIQGVQIGPSRYVVSIRLEQL